MNSTLSVSLGLALWLLMPGAGSAQLVRQQNTTLAFPAELPVTTAYDTENALGTLTFANPICIASAPGETKRVFIVERGDSEVFLPATIQAVDLSAKPQVKTTFF